MSEQREIRVGKWIYWKDCGKWLYRHKLASDTYSEEVGTQPEISSEVIPFLNHVKQLEVERDEYKDNESAWVNALNVLSIEESEKVIQEMNRIQRLRCERTTALSEQEPEKATPKTLMD